MTTRIVENEGQITWSSARDIEGHTEYRITYRIESDHPGDGPEVVRATPGLPNIGAMWNVDNDINPWAFRQPTDRITPVVTGEPNFFWDIELVFSTKPAPPGQQRCNDQQIEDPLMEPPKISGGSTKYTEEATNDRFSNPVCSSSWEPFRGQQNEWDANRSSIRIEINVLNFSSVVFALAMRDCVNVLPIWGFDRRCVKLSNVTWERKFYGLCTAYFTLIMEFDTNPATFDRNLMDEGHKALKGHWDGVTGKYVLDKIGIGTSEERWPSRFNPSDFIKINDREGNPTRMVLNGFGLPAGAQICFTPDAPLEDYGVVTDEADAIRYISTVNTNLSLIPPTIRPTAWTRIYNYADWALGVPPGWRGDLMYATGSVVIAGLAGGNTYFIAIAGNAGDPPPSANWLILPSGVTDRNEWSNVTTYNTGDFVRVTDTSAPVGTPEVCFYTGIGFRHVQRYHEANFLALGIPAFF